MSNCCWCNNYCVLPIILIIVHLKIKFQFLIWTTTVSGLQLEWTEYSEHDIIVWASPCQQRSRLIVDRLTLSAVHFHHLDIQSVLDPCVSLTFTLSAALSGHPNMVHMQRMAHPGSRMPGPMNPVVSEFNVRILDRLRSLQFAAKVLLFPYHETFRWQIRHCIGYFWLHFEQLKNTHEKVSHAEIIYEEH